MIDKIQIYGPGCSKCTSLAEVTKQAVNELQWDISVEKVTDPLLFAEAGVLLTPSLVVDGKILISGKVPSVKTVKDILSEAGKAPLQEGSCCSGKKEQKTQVSSCGCGSGGCGGESNAVAGCCSGWKKAIVWVVALLILLVVVKLANRGKPEGSESNSSAVPAMQERVGYVYDQYGADCSICIRMESWTKEAIKGNFSEVLITS